MQMLIHAFCMILVAPPGELHSQADGQTDSARLSG
jgi:hypothetical protein